jgi:hypothetical protein
MHKHNKTDGLRLISSVSSVLKCRTKLYKLARIMQNILKNIFQNKNKNYNQDWFVAKKYNEIQFIQPIQKLFRKVMLPILKILKDKYYW